MTLWIASAKRLTLPLVIPATEMRPSLVAYTECWTSLVHNFRGGNTSHSPLWPAYPFARVSNQCTQTYRSAIRISNQIHIRAVLGGTYLRCDMAPVMLAPKPFKILLQKSSHVDDSISHILDLTKPLLLESRIVQDLGCNASTMDRWIGV